jgi:ABC-2 type transport system permease protein
MSRIGVVLRKEWLELYWRGRPTGMFWAGIGQGVSFVAIGLLFAITMSYTTDMTADERAWGATGMVVFFAAMSGGLAPLTTVVDAVAGERERHTLETLLARPLKDHEIFLGKAGAQVVYALLIAALSILVAGVALLTLFGASTLVPWLVLAAASIVLAAIAAAFLVALAMLVSARAPTVKAGQQRLGLVFMVFLFIPIVGPFVAASGARPGADLVGIVFVLGLICAATFVLVVLAALLRFKRQRLLP